MRLILLLAASATLGGLILLSLDALSAALAALTEWARTAQATYQDGLVHAVKAWQESPGSASLTALVTACFLYGIFHAVGPGHGKAVLSAYAATAQVRLREVLGLSALTAAVQATVAVALVASAFLVASTGMRWVSRQATDILEPASYGAIMMVGGWLILGALRPLVARFRTPGHHGPALHDHAHDGGCCGHHVPPAQTPDGRSGAALAVAAGLRPCTGSLLVVALCFSLDLWGLGIAAPYIIGAGTALTVALLAGGVHTVRGPAAALARLARLPERTWRPISVALRLAGGGFILLLGGLMLRAALSAPSHPFG